MLTELQKEGVLALLRSGWSYGKIATLIGMPESVVLTVQLDRDAPPIVLSSKPMKL